MKSKWLCIWSGLWLLPLVLAACSWPDGQEATPTITPWLGCIQNIEFKAPHHLDTIPLAPYTIQLQAYSPHQTCDVSEFRLSIDGSSVGAISPSGYFETPGGQYWQTSYLWNATEGWHSLSVYTINYNSQPSPSVEIMVYVEIKAAIDVAVPIGEIGPVDNCFYTALVNLFCRQGPGIVYPRQADLFPGDSLPLVGLSTEGDYAYLQFSEDAVCAAPLHAKYAELSQDCDAGEDPILERLQVFTPPPTPMPPPTATSTMTPTKEPHSGGSDDSPAPDCTPNPLVGGCP